MSQTQDIPLVSNTWSLVVADGFGYITNNSFAGIYYRVASTQPADEIEGHNLRPEDHINYNLTPVDKLWARTKDGNGRVVVTGDSTVSKSPMQLENLDSVRSTFQSLEVSQPIPIANVSAQYGILKDVRLRLGPGGIGGEIDDLYHMESGVELGGFASITTVATMTFRPGQGEHLIFDARFTPGVPGSEQFSGAINANSGMGVGREGENYGILVRFGGIIEIQELILTVPSTGGVGSVTIDGTSYPITLTGAGSVEEDAQEIAEQLPAATVPLWQISAVSNKVVMDALISAEVTGSFSYTPPPASVGSFNQVAAGVLPTSVWTVPANWSEDPMMDLIPENINTYKVAFGPNSGYLYVWDWRQHKFRLVHVIDSNNFGPSLLVSNPTFSHSWYAFNRSNTSNVVTEGSFAGMFREGPDLVTNSEASVTSIQAVATTFIPLLTVRVRGNINDVINLAKLLVLDVRVSTESAKAIHARLTINGALTGALYEYHDEEASIFEVDTSATAITGGIQLELSDFGLISFPNEFPPLIRYQTFTIEARHDSGGATSVTALLGYKQDL